MYKRQVLVEVVRSGSFVGAAEVLGMSKAAVSRHISELEALSLIHI